MKKVEVTVVKAIKVKNYWGETKSYRTAHSAALAYSTSRAYISWKKLNKDFNNKIDDYELAIRRIYTRVHPIFKEMLK